MSLWTLTWSLRQFLAGEIILLLNLALVTSIYGTLLLYRPDPLDTSTTSSTMDYVFVQVPVRMLLVVLFTVDIWHQGLLALGWYKYQGPLPLPEGTHQGKWEGDHAVHAWITFGVILGVALINAGITFAFTDITWGLSSIYILLALAFNPTSKPPQVYITLILSAALIFVAMASSIAQIAPQKQQEHKHEQKRGGGPFEGPPHLSTMVRDGVYVLRLHILVENLQARDTILCGRSGKENNKGVVNVERWTHEENLSTPILKLAEEIRDSAAMRDSALSEELKAGDVRWEAGGKKGPRPSEPTLDSDESIEWETEHLDGEGLHDTFILEEVAQIVSGRYKSPSLKTKSWSDGFSNVSTAWKSEGPLYIILHPHIFGWLTMDATFPVLEDMRAGRLKFPEWAGTMAGNVGGGDILELAMPEMVKREDVPESVKDFLRLMVSSRPVEVFCLLRLTDE
ncbi:hypothetical protein P7C70_g8125, partial [Phenoliferia sp. Uapishka_3]